MFMVVSMFDTFWYLWFDETLPYSIPDMMLNEKIASVSEPKQKQPSDEFS